ncbi:MAG: hypothetical protein JWN94_4904 [Betaproteobacteria bacterium]|nr:hypothetical protein [Betaproteobacteria bacterium]
MLIRSIVLAIYVAAAMPAHAGGDDYDASNDVKGQGPAYFGFVRDARGSPVVDAQVMLQPKKGKPMALKSNVLGVYRGHISKDVLPDDVQISCVKTGYKQIKINRRTPPGGNAMFIETECTMQRL